MADYPAPSAGWLRSSFLVPKGAAPELKRDLPIRYLATALSGLDEFAIKMDWLQRFSPDNHLECENPADVPHALVLLAVERVSVLSVVEFAFVMAAARHQIVSRHWDADLPCVAIFMPEWIIEDIEAVLGAKPRS